MDKDHIYLEWGKGERNIVFLHYFGGSAQSWQWVAEKLFLDFRCIALNLPGFGNTLPLENPSIAGFAQWIHKQLVLLDIFDCTIVGHSMSGKIALQLAATQTEIEIDHLVLLAPSPPTYEPMPQAERERMLIHPDRKEAEQTVKQATVKKLTPERKELAIETQLIIDSTTWRWWLQKGMQHSIAELMPQVDVPTTLLVSEDDPVISIETVQKEIVPFLPKAQLILARNTGHLIPLEDPDWVAEQIKNIAK
ncbi:alpha/beta fold hydrolase [Catalinimonas niigatensis]|uniref:alpha/beta fold hydrolase n=1 Tax=Catalinimonas niigatensis TaxID=1397264 RepID=UPI002665A4F3|nr:alpha/beta hydrolase [Catalinimonas niigatensis]WPP51180.1 alpha/beta hydrolase [Catalinimonas niigatensis]